MNRLKALRGLERDLGAEVLLVGGVVRDLLRRKKPNDIDVVVRNVPPAQFEGYLRKRGKLRLVGQSFGVYVFTPRKQPDVTLEIAFPRTEISTGVKHKSFRPVPDHTLPIEEDSKRRDFTINAMYLPLNKVTGDWKFDKNDVIDFHSGRHHIRQRLIVAVGSANARIREDPVRMLRAAVLVARTRYRLESRTFMAIRQNARRISHEPGERARDELIKIMASDKPSGAFKVMRRSGLLKVVLPELDACVGCGQNPKHHSYPVWEHMIYAADAACKLTPSLEVRFAAIFHDLGKVPTRRVRPGGEGKDDVSFHSHELASVELINKVMQRLRFSNKFTEDVVHLVRYHQYKYDREWTPKAVRRFIRSVGITATDLGDLDNYPLFLLRQADRAGNKYKEGQLITQKQRDFQRRIQEIYRESTAHTPQDLQVDGGELMREFGLKTGPMVGNLLRFLFEAVEETPKLNNRKDLLRTARRFLDKEEGTNTTPEKRSTSGIA